MRANATYIALSVSFATTAYAESSDNVAQFVAQGIGLTPSSSASSSAASRTATSFYTNSTSSFSNPTAFSNVTTAFFANRPSPSPTLVAGDNGTFVGADQCWSSWDNYWSASRSSVDVPEESLTSEVWLSTITTTRTYTSEPEVTTLYTETEYYTTYFVDGGFTLSTSTVSYDTTETGRILGQEDSTMTATLTWSSITTLSAANVTVPSPSCTLPPSVPQCQSSWESWISTQLAPVPTPPPHCDIYAGLLNNRTVPACALAYDAEITSYQAIVSNTAASAQIPYCSAASISGSLCQSVRDNYVHQGNYAFYPNITGEAWFFSQGTQGLITDYGSSTVWTWPTSSTLGVPSCTLGCGRCAVTGGTVQLIYWPETATAFAGNLSALATASPKPTATGLVTVETLGTTFTSPTLYISYKNVYAENACSRVGSELRETILAIPTDVPLSSVYAGTIPCDAHFRVTQYWTATAPFNVTDLYTTSVPFSIYSSQPWCASYQRENNCAPSCPTTEPYKPILVVPDSLLQGMEPSWSTCYGDIRGQYDPPLPLQYTSQVAGPSVLKTTTSNMASPTVYPSPASSPDNTQPSQTAALPTPSASQGQDNLPTTTSTDASATSPTSASVDQSQDTTKEPTTPTSADQSSPVVVDTPTTSENSPQPAPTAYPVSDGVSSGGQSGSAVKPGSPSTADTSAAPGSINTVSNGVSGGGQSPSAVISGVESHSPSSSADAGGVLVSLLHGTTGSAAVEASSGKTSADPGDPATSQVTQPNAQATIASTALEPTTATNPGSLLASLLGGSEASSLATVASEKVSVDPSDHATPQASQLQAHTTLSLAATTPITTTIGGATVTLSPVYGGSSSAVVIAHGSSTVTLSAEGSAATIGSQVLSLPSAGGVVVAATGVAPETAATTESSQNTIILADQTFTASTAPGGAIVVANGQTTTTIAVGQEAGHTQNTVVLGSQTFTASAASGGGIVVVNSGTTATISGGQSAATTSAGFTGGPQNTIVLGGQTFTASAASSGGIVVANGGITTTISEGQSAATINGEVVSAVLTSALVLGAGTAATTIAIDPSTAANPLASAIALGSQTLTVSNNQQGDAVLSNEATTITLSAGGTAVTVGSVAVSEASDGAVVTAPAVTGASSLSQSTNAATGATRSTQTTSGPSSTKSSTASGTLFRPSLLLWFWAFSYLLCCCS